MRFSTCRNIRGNGEGLHFSSVFLFAAVLSFNALAAGVSPRAVFENPPKEAHAGVWWHWMGGQVSKEGIEKDLDWFVRMGISSATIFGMADATVPWAKRIADIPTGIHPYDDEWWRFVKFACAEGKKRGIDIGLHNCPGYTSTGGKWITPRLAMRKLVFGVKNPAEDIQLKAESPFPIYVEDKGVFTKPDCPARRSDYQPIAVVRGVEVGHIPTGSYVQPADWDSFGLECDKMNPEAVSFHLDHVISEWKRHLGSDLRVAGLQHVLLDSYEAGNPTWTPNMRAEFLARRGYDCLDFLPILGGYTNLYTEAECKKFRSDFDRTIKDLYRDVLFKIMHERLSAEGIQFSCEPYHGPWVIPEVAPYIDRIMTEFWYRPGNKARVSARGHLFNTYRNPHGKCHNIVEAEAFTSGSRWIETPASLKACGDYVWLQGVNRFVLHSVAHQPWGEDIKPGVTMGRWGTHFGRNQTWAESGKAWFDYIARSQALLQWGRPASGRLKLPFGEIARTDGKVRIHFLVNGSDEEKPLELPEGGTWYDPVTGEIGNPPVKLAARQSGFYELNISHSEKKGKRNSRASSQSCEPCVVRTVERWSPALGDWTQSSTLRDFSGTMTYRATFDCVSPESGAELDLGTVHCATAEVRVNGRNLGTVWCAPWRVKIPGGVLKSAGNAVEIDVTNTWRNRLIADEAEKPDVKFSKAPYPGGDMMIAYPDWFKKGLAARPSKGRKCFATWNYFTASEKDNERMRSGLVGPVTIRMKGAELSDAVIPWSLEKVNPAEIAIIPAPREMRRAKGRCSGSVKPEFEVDESIPPEGYVLSVTPNAVTVKSSDKAGAFYARMTLRQMICLDSKTKQTFYPCVEIKDSPQYKWRGVHLDDVRHFFGKETVMRILDLMALHKMNRFHWHLTDESGWRIDVPKYPELVRKGAVRKGKMRHRTQPRQRKLDGQPYGPYFYTESDIREIIAYAAERHITIVPEIEFPAHCYAALTAYPQLTCFPQNMKGCGPKCTWGQVRDFFCVGSDEAIAMMEDILSYVANLFPGDVIHIGGDECPVGSWKKCPKCQARIKAEGLKGVNDLQPWLTRHFVSFLEKRGKRTVGWDEYLLGDIPKQAIGMSWRAGTVVFGHKFLTPLECVKRGHDLVMAPHSHCYLNNTQCLPEDPFQYTGGRITLEKCYSFNPCEGIPTEWRGHILGGQCCNWTEYTWNEYDLEWKMWPRACAIAEVLWTGDRKPGFADFKSRIVPHRKRLVSHGVNCAPLKQP